MKNSGLSVAGRRVLVTGGTDFVGSHFVDSLLKVGANVRVTLHRRPLVDTDRRIETVEADLNDCEACLHATAGVDAVVHAAGRSAGAGVGPQDALL